MPPEPNGRTPSGSPAIPLSRWATRKLRELASVTGSSAIAALGGPVILGERAANGGYVIPGLRSAGLGGSRLLRTADDGWFALTLLRAEDRALLPALLGREFDQPVDDDTLARAVRDWPCDDILARARDLGLPAASADEIPASPPLEITASGRDRQRPPSTPPLVVDLSAIWAGPLTGHLFWLAGATVIKVESAARPDLIRRDDPATFDIINQGKASVAVDLSQPAERDALIALIRRADIVIESSRLRALVQLGIDADSLVRETPGLVWLSVTGHGARGDAAHWTGVGNDCSVAAGISRAMVNAGGEMGYVGDALTDPLTGITAALEGWKAWTDGRAARMVFSMSAIGALALAEERTCNSAALDAELKAWSDGRGLPFPPVPRRPLVAPVHPIGTDTAAWLPC